MSGLPYEQATILSNNSEYTSGNDSRRCALDVAYDAGAPIADKSVLDKWLTERYCVYFDDQGRSYRYGVHHKEWPLSKMNVSWPTTQYQAGAFGLPFIPRMLCIIPRVCGW